MHCTFTFLLHWHSPWFYFLGYVSSFLMKYVHYMNNSSSLFPVDKKNCPRVITAKLILFIKPFKLFSIMADISLSPAPIYTYCALLSNSEKQPVTLDCLPHKQVFISLKLTLILAMTTYPIKIYPQLILIFFLFLFWEIL